jgi:Flp pilus assembly protein TadB
MKRSCGEGSVMSRRWQLAVGGIVIAIILLIVGVPLWVPVVVVLAALAVPAVGYMMLDSNQKARVRRMRERKQLP